MYIYLYTHKYYPAAILHTTTHIHTAACPSFNMNYPPMRTLLCPGDSITYTCALATSNVGIITTRWSGSGFQCPSNHIVLIQQSGQPLNTAAVPCGNFFAVMTNISGTCYTSVLTIPTPQYYNGATVQCLDTSLTTVGNVTLNVQLACKLVQIQGLLYMYMYINTYTTVPRDHQWRPGRGGQGGHQPTCRFMTWGATGTEGRQASGQCIIKR